MNKINKFLPEVRERAVLLVLEHREEHPSPWPTVESIAPKIGCVPQTLLEWVKRAQVGAGASLGASAADLQRIKDLEHENDVDTGRLEEVSYSGETGSIG